MYPNHNVHGAVLFAVVNLVTVATSGATVKLQKLEDPIGIKTQQKGGKEGQGREKEKEKRRKTGSKNEERNDEKSKTASKESLARRW